MAFTSIAMLYFGFMGLWENTIDTIALMVVSVAIAVAVGLPLGVVGARSQIAGQHNAPDTGRDANDAELCVLASGYSLLRIRFSCGHFRNA